MFKFLLSIMVLSTQLLSHSGKTAIDGCHYCRSNCEKYGLKINERHAHNENIKCDRGNSSNPTIYNRSKFKHWIDTDKDCQNTRAEVLISRSKKIVTYRKSKNCVVDTGLWNDYYFEEVLVSASEIDIDHIVPLKNAWISGANIWSAEKREKFANDPENLVLTNKKYNRQKGAKTPLEWAPLKRLYYCKYLNDWIRIKRKYELRINKMILKYQQEAECL